MKQNQHYTSCFLSKQTGINKTHHSTCYSTCYSNIVSLRLSHWLIEGQLSWRRPPTPTNIYSQIQIADLSTHLGLSSHAPIYCTAVCFDLLWRRMKSLRATVGSRRKLRGKLCEISDDTERPGLWTAEKSSSSINPPRLEILSTAQLSYKFCLVDGPVWILHMKALNLSKKWTFGQLRTVLTWKLLVSVASFSLQTAAQ